MDLAQIPQGNVSAGLGFWLIPPQSNSRLARRTSLENVHAQATIGFGFTSDWLTKWRENFKPIGERRNAKKPMQLANYFRHSIENRSNVRVRSEHTDHAISPQLGGRLVEN